MIIAIKYNIIDQAGIKGKTTAIISGERAVREFLNNLKSSVNWSGELENKTYHDFGIQICDFFKK